MITSAVGAADAAIGSSFKSFESKKSKDLAKDSTPRFSSAHHGFEKYKHTNKNKRENLKRMKKRTCATNSRTASSPTLLAGRLED